MKRNHSILCNLAALLLAAAIAGCTTPRTNPQTGASELVYDPVKTEKVVAAVTPIVASAVRRVVLQHEDPAAVERYLRAVGSVFCAASESGQLGPEQVLAALDAATGDPAAGWADELVDGKNALLALYKVFYADRFKAELPADKWPRHVATIICQAIDTGLRDAGKPGVKP